MNQRRLLSTAALYGLAALLVFTAMSLLAWQLFPYPSGSTPPVRTQIWLTHLIAEKTGNILICCIVAFLAAKAYRPSWKLGVLTGVAAAIAFQIFAVVVYLMRFGFAVYATYHTFIRTMLETIIFGGLFSFVAAWPQYRRKMGKEV